MENRSKANVPEILRKLCRAKTTVKMKKLWKKTDKSLQEPLPPNTRKVNNSTAEVSKPFPCARRSQSILFHLVIFSVRIVSDVLRHASITRLLVELPSTHHSWSTLGCCWNRTPVNATRNKVTLLVFLFAFLNWAFVNATLKIAKDSLSCRH